MSAATDFLENEVLDHVFRNASYTPPTNVYVGLHLTGNDPTEAGGGIEISGNGYARTQVTFDAASGGTISNQLVTFPAASGGNWGTVHSFSIWDASANGNMLAYGQLTADKVINDGDQLKFSAGNLTISLA